MYKTVLYEKSNGVANLALNRPEKLNAFNGQLHEDLHDALDIVAADDEVRCVVLRGEGRGFSAGADLQGEDLQRDGDETPDLGEYLRKTYSQTIKKITGMEKPMIAALHGPVYGAGVGLALACDLRVAAREREVFGGVHKDRPDARRRSIVLFAADRWSRKGDGDVHAR